MSSIKPTRYVVGSRNGYHAVDILGERRILRTVYAGLRKGEATRIAEAYQQGWADAMREAGYRFDEDTGQFEKEAS